MSDVRPCPMCGGSGERYMDDITDSSDYFGSEIAECHTCEGMPRLPLPDTHRGLFGDVYEWATHRRRGWFYPDPETVMRWCEAHKSVVHADTTWDDDDPVCARSLHGFVFDGWGAPCDIGWVARPKRLETL